MNVLDIAIVIILGVSIAYGLIKGLVKEVFSLAGVLIGLFLAFLLAPQVGAVLERWIHVESAAYAVAMIVVFVLALIGVAIVSHLVTKFLEFAHLGWANRLLGGGFGVIRGGVIGLVLVLVLALFVDEHSPLLADSTLAPLLALGARIMAPLLPEGPRDLLLERLDDLGSMSGGA